MQMKFYVLMWVVPALVSLAIWLYTKFLGDNSQDSKTQIDGYKYTWAAILTAILMVLPIYPLSAILVGVYGAFYQSYIGTAGWDLMLNKVILQGIIIGSFSIELSKILYPKGNYNNVAYAFSACWGAFCFVGIGFIIIVGGTDKLFNQEQIGQIITGVLLPISGYFTAKSNHKIKTAYN